jgi:hypothetical protein
MHSGQSGIFALGTGSHAYLEFDLKPGLAPLEMVRAIASVRAPSITTGGVNMVGGGHRGLLFRPFGASPEEFRRRRGVTRRMPTARSGA